MGQRVLDFEKLVEGVSKQIHKADTVCYDFVDKQWSGRVNASLVTKHCEDGGIGLRPRDDEMQDCFAEFFVGENALVEACDSEAPIEEVVLLVLFKAIKHEGPETLPGAGSNVTICPEVSLKVWWDEAQEAMGVKVRYRGKLK